MYISVKDAKNRLSELLHRAEAGEKIILTRHGKPVVEMHRHEQKRGGIDFEAGRRFMKEHNIDRVVTYIAPDFDDPLPEDFLITPITFPDETA
jgi:antitoxin (DNA-binding transcriptional repressor) of toxin-antitoxin stability system